jgi:hypothetical protein
MLLLRTPFHPTERKSFFHGEGDFKIAVVKVEKNARGPVHSYVENLKTEYLRLARRSRQLEQRFNGG